MKNRKRFHFLSILLTAALLFSMTVAPAWASPDDVGRVRLEKLDSSEISAAAPLEGEAVKRTNQPHVI